MILYISMKKTIKLILLLCWMGLIFFLSAQVAEESTITTNFVIEILYKIYSVFNKVDMETFINSIFTPVRKIAHFSEFTILGVLIYLNLKEYRRNRVVLLSIAFSCLYAISDEIHQIFVPGRFCAIGDMLIDTCGAALGVLIIHLIVERWIKN